MVSTRGFLASLYFPDYRRLWVATALAQSGHWALIAVRAALTLEVTGSPAWVGIITFSAMIPSLVVNPIGGYLADRLERRTLLAASFAFNGFINLFLAVLVLGDVIQGPWGIWYLLVLSALNGAGRAVQMPTTQALLPNLVPRERLLNAIALNQTLQQGSRMAGPLLTLPFILTVGPEAAFFLCAGLYLVGIPQIAAISTISRGALEVGRGTFYNLVAGLRYVYRHRVIRSIILLNVAHCSLTMAFESLFPLLAREELGLSEGSALFAGPSYLMIGLGAGAVLGTFMLAGIQAPRSRSSVLFLAGLFSALSPLGLAFSPNVPTAMLAAGGVGAATAAFMTLTNTIIQSIVPDSVRGRVISVNLWHILGMMAGFNFVNGAIAEVAWITAPLIFIVTGLLFLAVMLVSLLEPPLRQIYTRGVPATGAAALRPEMYASST